MTPREGRVEMSVFTDAEIEYLGNQFHAYLATVGADGQPHVVPVTFRYNPDEDTIDVGGMNFGTTKKWRDAKENSKVTFLVDDVLQNPRRARALEVRGTAEAHETGGGAINPRFPRFAPQFLRIRPARIVAWGLEEGGVDGRLFNVNARSVG
jgi:pyridoxamine 5'-phosphate oxidase family protein